MPAVPGPETTDDRPEAEILEELGLPKPETMGPGDDFSAFLREGVPAKLKARALRRLWISNPVLANLDELVDYGEDFTDAATVVENLQTAYRVGRGMLRDEEREAEPEAETTYAEPEAGGEANGIEEAAEAPDSNEPEAAPDVAEAPPEPEPAITAEKSFEPNTAALRRRKMRFDLT